MEIKLGIRNLNRELIIETDTSAEEVERSVRDALNSDGAVFSITDTKGRTTLVPGRQLAYAELGDEIARPVGFGAL